MFAGTIPIGIVFVVAHYAFLRIWLGALFVVRTGVASKMAAMLSSRKFVQDVYPCDPTYNRITVLEPPCGSFTADGR